MRKLPIEHTAKLRINIHIKMMKVVRTQVLMLGALQKELSTGQKIIKNSN